MLTLINIYLSKSLTKYLLINTIVISILIIFINIIEISRIVEQENTTLKIFIYLSLLKLPTIINETTPFIIIISIAFLYRNLISNNELISMRNMGYSIIDIYIPIGITIIIYGFTVLILLNPLISISENKFIEITSKKNSDIYSIKFIDSGMWIKNISEKDEKSFINIEDINLNSMLIKNIKILNISKNTTEIILAKEGKVKDRIFDLKNVSKLNIDTNKYTNLTNSRFAVNFNKSNIIDAISNYKFIPYYKYYDHIKNLKKFDLHSSEISLYYLSEILKPFFLMIIGFVVMSFSSKFKRNENFFKVLFVAVLIGFLIFLFKEIVTNYTSKSDTNFIFSYSIIITLPLLMGLYQVIKIEKN